MNASHVKLARPDHPIHELLAARYSPYVFEPRPVEREKLLACLEAARWAASSFNEQPWSFLLAERGDQREFQRMLGCLMEANQAWARHAGVLLITVVKPTFTKNDKPNRVAEHDVGLALGNFCLQASALGLAVHQMAGVDLEQARREYSIPPSHAPLTGVALGYAGDPDQSADANLAQRDRTPRDRRPLRDFVFHGQFGQTAPGL
jgi:nitroreductase